MIGYVFRRIVRRFSILADVRPEEREIPGMPRPFEVIDIAAELTYGVRRRIDQTDVPEAQILEQQELLPLIHGGHGCVHIRFAGFHLFLDVFYTILDGFVPVLARHVAGYVGVNARGDIHNFLYHRCRVVWSLKLLVSGGGVKSVSNVVVFLGRIVLDRHVGHMVVGDYQAVPRHKRSGSSSEIDNGPGQSLLQVCQRQVKTHLF